MSLERLLAPIGGKDVCAASPGRQAGPSFILGSSAHPLRSAGSPTACPSLLGSCLGCLLIIWLSGASGPGQLKPVLPQWLGSQKLRQGRGGSIKGSVEGPWRTEAPNNLFMQHVFIEPLLHARQMW